MQRFLMPGARRTLTSAPPRTASPGQHNILPPPTACRLATLHGVPPNLLRWEASTAQSMISATVIPPAGPARPGPNDPSPQEGVTSVSSKASSSFQSLEVQICYLGMGLIGQPQAPESQTASA